MMPSRRHFMAALFGTAAILPTTKIPTPGNVYEHLKSCWTWYEAKDIQNALPTRIGGIVSRKEDSFTVLSDRHRDLIRLNPAAAHIWELCDGSRSVDGIVMGMISRYDVSPRVCTNDVLVTLRDLRRKGLITC